MKEVLYFRLSSKKELVPLEETNLSIIRLESGVTQIDILIKEEYNEYDFYMSGRINDGKVQLLEVEKTDVQGGYFHVKVNIKSNLSYKDGILSLQLKWTSKENAEVVGASRILSLIVYESLALEDDYEDESIFIAYEQKLNDIIRQAKEELGDLKITDVINKENYNKIPTVKAVMEYYSEPTIKIIDGGVI